MQNEDIKKLYGIIEQLNSFKQGKGLRDVIRGIRHRIRQDITVDPYTGRGNVAYYGVPRGKYLLVALGNMEYQDNYTVRAKDVWIDNYRDWREGKCNKLYSKEECFRIGNDYYAKNDFIEHNGVAYPRDQWVEFDGQILEKSKICTCTYYTYGYSSQHKKEIALKADEGEEFFDPQTDSHTKLFVEVSNTGNGMRCKEFVKSLFRIGNKRIMPTYNAIPLTKEALEHFNLKISDSHLIEMAKDVNVVSVNDAKKDAEKLILQGLNCTNFRIKFYGDVRNTSVKNRLLNMVVKKLTRRRYNEGIYGVKELFCRLRAIKRMYEVEAEYAK